MPITRVERVNFGRLAVIEAEATYNSGYTGTGGDNIYCLEDPIVRARYLTDGDRGRSWVNGGRLLPGGGRYGVFAETSIVTQAGGPVNPWSATVRPSIHRLMQGCGHGVALDTTPGAERWTYTPPAQPLWNSDQSIALRCHWHGMRQDLAGAFGSFEFSADGLGIPTWTFNYTGLLPAGSLDNSVDEASTALNIQPLAAAYPTAHGVTIQMGDYINARVRSFRFTQNREVMTRADQNVAYTALSGLVGGRRTPEWEMVIEATPKVAGAATTAGVNPWSMATGTAFNLQYKVTSNGSYAPYRFEMPRATVNADGFEQESDGPVVLWRLRGSCHLAGDGSASDYDYRIVFPNA